MTHSLHLPRTSRDGGNGSVSITPEEAGWTYTGLTIIELAAGEARAFDTEDCEMAVLPLAGSCTVECEGESFRLRGRDHVFARVTDFAYVPIGARVTVQSARGGRFALPNARATRRLDPRYGPAEEVPVEIRGAGRASRQINNFLEPKAFPADQLVAVEVVTPEGNWSSYPPHKHDEPGTSEAVLEEIYYFEMGRASNGRVEMGKGFGLQRLYTADGAIDLTEEVRHGDSVLIPRGYHGPSVAAPGYHMYYLNVLAGPGEQRSLTFSDDPEHAWVRASWQNQFPDPRLPLCTHEGAR